MDPLSIAAIGWGVTATGWFLSPYIIRLLDRVYAYLKPSKGRKKLKSLVDETVPRLKLILEAAEGSGHKDLFEKLLTDLKSAFYETEDILDEVEYIRRHKSGTKRKWSNLVTKVGLPGKSPKDGTKGKLDSTIGEGSSNQAIGTLSSLTIPGPLSNRLTDILTKIEKLIKSANKTLKLLKLRSNMGSDKNIQNVPAKNINRRPSTSDPTGKVTGREDDLEEIRERLRQTEDIERLSVIGIIGIPGSGKTTLAQCVCQSERSDSYFDLVMWIHVSQSFTIDSIYGEMFEQAWQKLGDTPNCPKYDSLNVLKDELKKVLNNKLFLLILDDIWFGDEEDTASEEKLKEILIPLVSGKRESKILVTSRQDSLLRLGPDVTSITYPVPDLDDAVFLELFMHYALDYNRVNDENKRDLQRIGAEIAVKLMKLPLLARVVGSILFRKRKIDVADWINVRDQNLLDKYMGPLWWSYQHLGEQARRCFAYCSIFPRRYPLLRDELVNLWVAEGFINSTKVGHEMENVGRDYFDELLSSSFLLPRGKGYSGKEYFVIHDLLYDLAVKVAGDDCFRIGNSWTSEVPLNVRHLSIQNCTASMVTEHIVKLKKLRTLIIYNAEAGIVFDNMFNQLSKALRVLIFGIEHFSVEDYVVRGFSFPESIGCLKHLRYLGFRTSSTITLPGTLDKLYLLQVLDFGSSAHTNFSFGEDMIKLTDLRHLFSRRELCFPNIGRLISLQTLPSFNRKRGEGYELHQLKLLNKLQGKLDIMGLECVESRKEALEAKLADKGVTELELAWDLWGKDYSLDLQADLLEVLCPPNIKELSIYGYESSRYPSWMVGTQKSTMYLRKLVLHLCCQPVCGPGHFFISVSSLVLQYSDWDTLPCNMEGLRSLELENCAMPSNLEYFTSLKSLVLQYDEWNITLPTLPKSLDYIEIRGWEYNREQDQSWEKIKHIPHIVLDTEEFKDLVGDGCEATWSSGRVGSSTNPNGTSGGFSTARNRGGPSGGADTV